jgi:hypothetical protein
VPEVVPGQAYQVRPTSPAALTAMVGRKADPP